jgi:hypothetical protein
MTSITVSSYERPHYGVHPTEWDVATTYLTLADDKPQQAKAYDSGHSTPSSRESDCGAGWPFFCNHCYGHSTSAHLIKMTTENGGLGLYSAQT